MIGSLAGIVLGTAAGARHAFEPDHLTAMATLVDEATTARRGGWLGALWGLGHTLSLLCVGGLLFALDSELPEQLAVGFELAVSVVLVALGVRSIVRALRTDPETVPHLHAHGDRLHIHGGVRHVHIGGRTLGRRPFLVGLIHGLAGSGALVALALAHQPSTGTRIVFIACFGIGSIAGMAAVSAAAAFAMRRLIRSGSLHRALVATAGTLSIVVGIAWAISLR